MISGMVLKVCGSYQIKYTPKPGAEEINIDFTPPFKRIPMMEELEKQLNVKFPPLSDPNLEQFLEDLLAQHDIQCEEPRTVARMLDKLVGDFIEDNIVSP